MAKTKKTGAAANRATRRRTATKADKAFKVAVKKQKRPSAAKTSSAKKAAILAFTRRDVLKGAGALTLTSLLPGKVVAAESPVKKPNILFVYVDQHRHDALGSAGNASIVTPTLDRLAHEGTRFSKLWVQSPVCRPARAALMYGRYPHETDIANNGDKDFDASLPNMIRSLKTAGYNTATFGKTHYTDSFGSDEDQGKEDFRFDIRATYDYIRSFGFDTVMEEPGQRPPANPGFSSSYTDYLRENGFYETYRREYGISESNRSDHWKPGFSTLPQEADITSFEAAKVMEWLGSRDKSKPFFVTFAPIKPHDPFVADPVWAKYYKDKPMPQGPRDMATATAAPWAQWLKRAYAGSYPEQLTRERIDECKRMYYAMISLVDQKLGEIMKFLEDQGELDNTWIIYTADHGETMGDHMLMGKMNFYRPSVTVPALIRPAANSTINSKIKAKNSLVDVPVETIDLNATLLDIAGAKPLANSHGRSLLPAMQGEVIKNAYAFSQIANRNRSAWFVAVTDGQYRYTWDKASNTPCELFNLKADPDELANLVDAPKEQPRIKTMQNELIKPHLNSEDI